MSIFDAEETLELIFKEILHKYGREKLSRVMYEIINNPNGKFVKNLIEKKFSKYDGTTLRNILEKMILMSMERKVLPEKSYYLVIKDKIGNVDSYILEYYSDFYINDLINGQKEINCFLYDDMQYDYNKVIWKSKFKNFISKHFHKKEKNITNVRKNKIKDEVANVKDKIKTKKQEIVNEYENGSLKIKTKNRLLSIKNQISNKTNEIGNNCEKFFTKIRNKDYKNIFDDLRNKNKQRKESKTKKKSLKKKIIGFGLAALAIFMIIPKPLKQTKYNQLSKEPQKTEELQKSSKTIKENATANISKEPIQYIESNTTAFAESKYVNNTTSSVNDSDELNNQNINEVSMTTTDTNIWHIPPVQNETQNTMAPETYDTNNELNMLTQTDAQNTNEVVFKATSSDIEMQDNIEDSEEENIEIINKTIDISENYSMEMIELMNMYKEGMEFYAQPYANIYSKTELFELAAIVSGEDNTSYEGALAVISTMCNRADDRNTDPLTEAKRQGQYTVYGGSYYNRHKDGSVPDYVLQAVYDCLAGKRNTTAVSFRAKYKSGRLLIGTSRGNHYFDFDVTRICPNKSSVIQR